MADGPFKIVLSEVEGADAGTLGNPALESAQRELARLFNLDEQMAGSILSATPIVILDGLEAHQAGVVRGRLRQLASYGCKVICTDEESDTIPRVNWPEPPSIAQVSDEKPTSLEGAEPAAPAPGVLSCPACNSTFHLVPAGNASAPPRQSSPPTDARSETRPAVRAQTEPGTPEPEAEDDDWMSPPVSRVATPVPSEPTPQPSSQPDPEPRGSGGTARFNEASLLAYRRAEAPQGPASPPPASPLPAPPMPSAQELDVKFSESSDGLQVVNVDTLPAPSAGVDPFEDSADLFGASSMQTPALDSGLDPFSESSASRPALNGAASASGLIAATSDPFDPPQPESGSREFEATGSLHDSGSDILDLDPPHRRGRDSGDFQDDFNLLEDSGEDRRPNLEELEKLEKAEARASRKRSKAAAATKPARGGDQLDDLLDMFGPEDEQPLDNMQGLEPAPLDLSPAGKRGRDPFGTEFPSDILEPLNPNEAMEIIKSQKSRGGQPSGAGNTPFQALESEDGLDLFADSGTGSASKPGRGRKKSRGVPFSVSDEDLDLFEDSSRPRSRKESGSGARKRNTTDPFARARKEMEEERSGSSKRGSSSRRRSSKTSPRNGASAKRKRSARDAGGGGGGSTGPAPKGAGDHGLVLSRISDPDKKDKAAELIAEIKGCSVDDAQRLTERTIIPVLKGVSREVAEFHLDKFRRYKIAGRVTTRQRSS